MALTVEHPLDPSGFLLTGRSCETNLSEVSGFWEEFQRTWQSDVQAGFYWVKPAIELPLPQGSCVLLGSSGAAVKGSPLSGAYAGAKRTLWRMAHYANYATAARQLGIHFQTIVPTQIPRAARCRTEVRWRRKGRGKARRDCPAGTLRLCCLKA